MIYVLYTPISNKISSCFIATGGEHAWGDHLNDRLSVLLLNGLVVFVIVEFAPDVFKEIFDTVCFFSGLL